MDFNGLKLIEEVNVFSMQDNYSSPVEPTPTMTSNNFAVRVVRGAVLDRVELGARARAAR